MSIIYFIIINSLTLKMMLDLYGMQPGKYSIDFIYKKKMIKIILYLM